MNQFFEASKYFCEAIALALILYIFFKHRSISLAIKTIPRIIWIPFLLLFLSQAIFQLSTRKQYEYPQTAEPFPFTRWAMFAGYKTNAQECTVYDWLGTKEDGSITEVNPAKLFVTTNAVTLFTKTLALANRVQYEESPEQATTALSYFAQGIINRHNELHPHSPIVSISLSARKFSLQTGTIIPKATDKSVSTIIFSHPH